MIITLIHSIDVGLSRNRARLENNYMLEEIFLCNVEVNSNLYRHF